MLVGWDFDSRMLLEPGSRTLAGPNQLGLFLIALVRKRPNLEIFILKSNLRLVPAFEGLWTGITPVALLNWLSGERIHLAVDGAHPTGAVHHQKLLVVDDAMAFSGGIDFTLERWDTSEHLNHNRYRRAIGRAYGPRHEVAVAVDGAAARALGELACTRWSTATGQRIRPVESGRLAWPGDLDPTITDIDVAIARTLPTLGDRSEVREVETFNLEAISLARRTIYIENQYLASRTIAEALGERLGQPDGPEVVVVMPRSSESRLEEESMDSARYRMLQLLWGADLYDRFAAYWPVTEGGVPIYVHAKVLVIDDRLLRIGSSNMNNRSMGFDSECDIAVEASGSKAEQIGRMVTSVQNRLVAEHLDVAVEDFEAAVAQHDSLLGAIESIRGSGRTLYRFSSETVAGEASLLAENDLMDPARVPTSASQSLKRWFRRLAESGFLN